MNGIYLKLGVSQEIKIACGLFYIGRLVLVTQVTECSLSLYYNLSVCAENY